MLNLNRHQIIHMLLLSKLKNINFLIKQFNCYKNKFKIVIKKMMTRNKIKIYLIKNIMNKFLGLKKNFTYQKI